MRRQKALDRSTFGVLVFKVIYVIRDFTTAESDGAIIDVMCTLINESSRSALECALRCECRAKKTVRSLYARLVLDLRSSCL